MDGDENEELPPARNLQRFFGSRQVLERLSLAFACFRLLLRASRRQDTSTDEIQLQEIGQSFKEDGDLRLRLPRSEEPVP